MCAFCLHHAIDFFPLPCSSQTTIFSISRTFSLVIFLACPVAFNIVDSLLFSEILSDFIPRSLDVPSNSLFFLLNGSPQSHLPLGITVFTIQSQVFSQYIVDIFLRFYIDISSINSSRIFDCYFYHLYLLVVFHISVQAISTDRVSQFSNLVSFSLFCSLCPTTFDISSSKLYLKCLYLCSSSLQFTHSKSVTISILTTIVF